MSTSTLIEQWYEEVWNRGNEEFIEKLMHKDVTIHGLDPAGTSKGIEHFKTFYANFRVSFPDTKIKVQHLVSNDEYATVYCTVAARSSSNRDVSFSGLCVCRFKNDKIIEGWNNFDFLKMYQQLGHILVSEISD